MYASSVKASMVSKIKE
jgi:hypothetical protein